jgi:hypothetical protein
VEAVTHLDATTWAALQAADDPALLAHVAEGCEQCDAFLATLPGFEGAVDASLLRVAPTRVNDSELAWARFKRPPRRIAWRSVGMAAAALLALSLVGGALAWRDGNASWLGLKGDGPASVELRAATRDVKGDLVALEPNASVRADSTLVFRVESTLAGPAQLFVQRGTRQPELVAAVKLEGGVQELDRADGLLGFSLEGERGPVVLWLVASEVPLSTSEALLAIRRGGDRTIGVGKLQVDVTP